MSMALHDEHVALQDVVRAFLERQKVLEAGRSSLDLPPPRLPEHWSQMSELGWFGIHLPEEHDGMGYGLVELALVVFELGRAVAPGPFLPTVACSAALQAVAPGAAADVLRGLADGSLVGAVGTGGDVELLDGRGHGDAGVVLGAPTADVLLLRAGDAAILVPADQQGVSVVEHTALDRSRSVGRVHLTDVVIDDACRLDGTADDVQAVAWALAAADAAGAARACTDAAVAYAKVREQFGQPIGKFQAVKHHCADMLVATELATAAAWDAANALDEGVGAEARLAAAVAAEVVLPAAVDVAHLNVQVHGGLGFTWEHEAHLYVRRSVALHALHRDSRAEALVLDARRQGLHRRPRIELGPEEAAMRAEVRSFVERVRATPPDERAELLVAEGYVHPHWPAPWGRDASPAMQLIIDEELAAADIARPVLGITSWVVATIIQHGTEQQTGRWVDDALCGTVWCQLFSEPDAGSDAAAVRTRGVRVDGGWKVTGQKVWTSGAHVARWGLATVRTDPDAGKHRGITMMAIDMTAPGVDVRPLRQMTGASDFNEVFLSDVFVPDEDVVGPVGGGWGVARSTLGNERVSLGGADRHARIDVVGMLDASREPWRHAADVARLLAVGHTASLLETRRAQRAVAGTEPGPEGNVTKLVQAELAQDYAQVVLELTGPSAAVEGEAGALSSFLNLNARRSSIAGGTSEITRNQIAERILGLPR